MNSIGWLALASALIAAAFISRGYRTSARAARARVRTNPERREAEIAAFTREWRTRSGAATAAVGLALAILFDVSGAGYVAGMTIVGWLAGLVQLAFTARVYLTW